MLPSPHPAVMFQTVGDGAVLLHTQDEIYFGLNSIGARVWRMLPPACREIDEVCASLAAAYPGTDATMIRADVDELLTQLRGHHLVVDAA
jgi:hypothetical protein